MEGGRGRGKGRIRIRKNRIGNAKPITVFFMEICPLLFDIFLTMYNALSWKIDIHPEFLSVIDFPIDNILLEQSLFHSPFSCFNHRIIK